MMTEIIFWVPGNPKPAGSKRGFVNRKTGGVIITDACKLTKSWQGDVKMFAYAAMQGQPLMTGPLEMIVVFQQGRPKCHYGTGRNAGVLKHDAPLFPESAPDGSKLTRAVEDAMSKVIYVDDAQIVDQLVRKRYGPPGALITVRVKWIDRNIELTEAIRDTNQVTLFPESKDLSF